MTTAEAILLESCLECSGPIMKVPNTGLISCLASITFKPCRWHVRVAPFEAEQRKDRITKKEQRLARLEAEVRKRIDENKNYMPDIP